MLRNTKELIHALYQTPENQNQTAIINYVTEHATDNYGGYDRLELGAMALCIAIKRGHTAIVKAMLGINGVNVNARYEGRTPLMHAVGSIDANHSNKREIVDTLLGVVGIEVDAKNAYKDETALIIAINNPPIDIVKKLLDKGADVNLKFLNDETALSRALRPLDLFASHSDIAMELLNVDGIDVDAKTGDRKETALHIAIRNSDYKVVKRLIEKGAKVNLQDLHGNTALHLAINIKHHDIVTMLLGVDGVDVNATNNDGSTILMGAARGGNYKLVMQLLQCEGIDIHVRNKANKTALTKAIKCAEESVIDNGFDRWNFRVVAMLLLKLSPNDITHDNLGKLYEHRDALYQSIKVDHSSPASMLIEITKQIVVGKENTTLGKVFWYRPENSPLDNNDVIFDVMLDWLARAPASDLTEEDIKIYKEFKSIFISRIEAMFQHQQQEILNNIFDTTTNDGRNRDTAIARVFWAGRVDMHDITTRLGRAFRLHTQLSQSQPTQQPSGFDQFTNLFAVKSWRFVDRAIEAVKQVNTEISSQLKK